MDRNNLTPALFRYEVDRAEEDNRALLREVRKLVDVAIEQASAEYGPHVGTPDTSAGDDEREYLALLRKHLSRIVKNIQEEVA